MADITPNKTNGLTPKNTLTSNEYKYHIKTLAPGLNNTDSGDFNASIIENFLPNIDNSWKKRYGTKVLYDPTEIDEFLFDNGFDRDDLQGNYFFLDSYNNNVYKIMLLIIDGHPYIKNLTLNSKITQIPMIVREELPDWPLNDDFNNYGINKIYAYNFGYFNYLNYNIYNKIYYNFYYNKVINYSLTSYNYIDYTNDDTQNTSYNRNKFDFKCLKFLNKKQDLNVFFKELDDKVYIIINDEIFEINTGYFDLKLDDEFNYIKDNLSIYPSSYFLNDSNKELEFKYNKDISESKKYYLKSISSKIPPTIIYSNSYRNFYSLNPNTYINLFNSSRKLLKDYSRRFYTYDIKLKNLNLYLKEPPSFEDDLKDIENGSLSPMDVEKIKFVFNDDDGSHDQIWDQNNVDEIKNIFIIEKNTDFLNIKKSDVFFNLKDSYFLQSLIWKKYFPLQQLSVLIDLNIKNQIFNFSIIFEGGVSFKNDDKFGHVNFYIVFDLEFKIDNMDILSSINDFKYYEKLSETIHESRQNFELISSKGIEVKNPQFLSGMHTNLKLMFSNIISEDNLNKTTSKGYIHFYPELDNTYINKDNKSPFSESLYVEKDTLVFDILDNNQLKISPIYSGLAPCQVGINFEAHYAFVANYLWNNDLSVAINKDLSEPQHLYNNYKERLRVNLPIQFVNILTSSTSNEEDVYAWLYNNVFLLDASQDYYSILKNKFYRIKSDNIALSDVWKDNYDPEPTNENYANYYYISEFSNNNAYVSLTTFNSKDLFIKKQESSKNDINDENSDIDTNVLYNYYDVAINNTSRNITSLLNINTSLDFFNKDFVMQGYENNRKYFGNIVDMNIFGDKIFIFYKNFIIWESTPDFYSSYMKWNDGDIVSTAIYQNNLYITTNTGKIYLYKYQEVSNDYVGSVDLIQYAKIDSYESGTFSKIYCMKAFENGIYIISNNGFFKIDTIYVTGSGNPTIQSSKLSILLEPNVLQIIEESTYFNILKNDTKIMFVLGDNKTDNNSYIYFLEKLKIGNSYSEYWYTFKGVVWSISNILTNEKAFEKIVYVDNKGFMYEYGYTLLDKYGFEYKDYLDKYYNGEGLNYDAKIITNYINSSSPYKVRLDKVFFEIDYMNKPSNIQYDFNFMKDGRIVNENTNKTIGKYLNTDIKKQSLFYRVKKPQSLKRKTFTNKIDKINNGSKYYIKAQNDGINEHMLYLDKINKVNTFKYSLEFISDENAPIKFNKIKTIQTNFNK